MNGLQTNRSHVRAITVAVLGHLVSPEVQVIANCQCREGSSEDN